jgi:hypothetical protein
MKRSAIVTAGNTSPTMGTKMEGKYDAAISYISYREMTEYYSRMYFGLGINCEVLKIFNKNCTLLPYGLGE